MNDIERSTFGEVDGQSVDLFTLTNRGGRKLRVTNYGATVTELHMPDREGRLADVVLGFDRLQAYVDHRDYFGATVGRVANRIRGAEFVLEGQTYALAANDGAHHLHGGRRGWNRVVWAAEAESGERGPSVDLTYVSADGEEGYPGQVVASVRYTLTHEDELVVSMGAHSDRTTILNMAHHSYFNLGGEGSGDVLDHELSLESEIYTPGDPVVPVGHLESVAGTPFNFRRAKAVGRDLAQVGAEPPGFDHNWVLLGVPGRVRPVARLRHRGSGRVLTLEADAPGVQFYSGNFLDGSLTGKSGQRYSRHAGLCLETQAFPNAINVPDWAEQVILKTGQEYRHEMVHRFTSA